MSYIYQLYIVYITILVSFNEYTTNIFSKRNMLILINIDST